jgi:hypothetical protein
MLLAIIFLTPHWSLVSQPISHNERGELLIEVGCFRDQAS